MAMAYRIEGLAREAFAPLFALGDEELAERQARRVRAEGGGYPCRIGLEEAEEGESLILVNHVSQEAPTPFRASHAIYVREAAGAPPIYRDEVPPMLDTRILGLRGFDHEGMLRGAVLAMPGEADGRIRELLGRPEVASIHAHTAALGCFLAKVERD
jgi:hypothetical protein